VTCQEPPPPGSPPAPPFGANLRRYAPRALALTLVSLVIILLCYDAGLRLVVEALAQSQTAPLPPAASITAGALLGAGLAYLFYTALFRGRLHRRPLGPPWRSWVTLALALSLAVMGLAVTAVGLVLLAGIPFYTLSTMAVLACGWQMARGKL
jgi:hypothetical protein